MPKKTPKLLFALSLLAFPIAGHAFPVVVSTASQSILLLGALLLGAGGAASSNKLRVACLILLLIVGYQAYRQQVIVESMRMSQEHEFFLPQSADFAPVPHLSYNDFREIFEGQNSPAIVHLSNQYPIIYPGMYSTESSFDDLNITLPAEDTLYVLSIDPREASHTVHRWQDDHQNIVLIPYSTSDTTQYLKDAIGTFQANVILKTLSPQYETISHLFSKYNVIHLATNMGMKGSTHHGEVVLYDANLPFYADTFWASVKAGLDTEKETLIIATKREVDDRNDYAHFIANKLGLTDILYSNTPAVWLNSNVINADNLLTPGYPNQSRFLSQAELYVLQDESERYQVVCLSKGCLNYFPEPRRILWSHKDLLSYTHSGRYKITLPASVSNDVRYILAPMGSEEASVALSLGHALAEAGYQMYGFTFHPSQYYGATYDLGGGHIYYDDFALMYDRYVEIAIEFLRPDQALITDLNSLLLTGILFGLILVLPVKYMWVGVLGLLYFSVYFIDLVRLPLSHYQAYLFEPLTLSALFIAAMLPGLTARNAISLSLATVGVYYGSEYLLLPMDRFIGAILLTMAIVRAILLIGVFGRRLSGLQRPGPNDKILGSKCRLTLPWIRDDLTGFVVTRRRVSGLFLPGTSKRQWLLRSNHLDDRESNLAGAFESYKVTKKTLRSVMKDAHDHAKKELDRHRIQFWLQPYVDANTFGVASSHDLKKPSCVRLEYGTAGSVTEGFGGDVVRLSRWKKLEKNTLAWQKSLLKMIQTIEVRVNGPVIIEFAVQKNKPVILQVRPQLDLPDLNPDELKIWRAQGSEFKACEFMSVSRFGQDVLFHLYDGSLMVDRGTVLRLPVKGKSPLNSRECQRATDLMIDMRQTGQHLTIPVYRIVQKVKIALSGIPLRNLADSKLSDSDLAAYKRIHNYIMEHKITLAHDLDAGSEFMSVDSNLSPIKTASSRDLAHALVSLAIVIIHENASYKRLRNWQNATIEAIDDGVNGPEFVGDPNETERGPRTLVDGAFDGPQINLKGFLSLPEKERRNYVLAEDVIPGFAIESSLKAKAIIVAHATELSHIAICCRRSGTPLKTAPKDDNK